MDQEKIGKFIKDLRVKNKLTQNELAKRLGVTYQAVSKWENGKNIPDIAILKQISNEFNIDISDLLEGKNTKRNYKKNILIISIIIVIVLLFVLIYKIASSSSYEFRTITTSNKDFNINGVVAYSKDKNSLYISDIDYNGNNDSNEYKVVECTLYEKDKNTEIKISKCGDISKYKENSKTESLSSLLQNVTFKIGDYSHSCKNLSANDLYLRINALDKDDKTIIYKIPLKLDDECNNR